MAVPKTILLLSSPNPGASRLKAALRRLANDFELDFKSLEQIEDVDFEKYSLVMLDAIQPGKFYLDQCNQIKQNCGQKVPVVMLGQDDSLKTMVDAYKNGADYYIPWNETGEEVQISSMKHIIQRVASQYGKVSA
jgi:DNA-binding response OmpR family regulator